MDLSNVRRMSKQQYETVREQLEELGDRVTSRHGDDAPVRQGYRRFLGTLDGLAGRLLDDDEISQRGQDLLRDEEADGTTDGTGAPDEADNASAGGDNAWATAEAEAEAADKAKGPDVTDVTETDVTETGAAEEAAGTSGVAGAGAAGAEAGVAGAAEGAAAEGAAVEPETAGTGETAVVRGRTAPPRTEGSGAARASAARGWPAEAGPAETGPAESATAGSEPESGPAEVPVGDSWAAANARVAEENAAGDGPAAEANGQAANVPTVDVVFSLPADVQADRVALCGEFNDWSVESTTLAHQVDGSWSVTVPLVPGTYRYKYLLDGETWENGSDADRYEENAYGTLDSVVEVS
jgi:hypothetical protein